MNTDTLGSRIRGAGRGTAATIVTRVVDVFATYGFYAIIARSLPPASFGHFIVGLTVMQLGAAVARRGLDQALLASPASGATNRFAGARVAFASIAIAVSAAVGLWVWKRELSPYAIVLIAGLPIVALAQFVIGALRAAGRVASGAAAESVAQPVASLILALVVAKTGHAGVAAFGLAFIASWIAPLAFAVAVDWRGERIAQRDGARLVSIGASMVVVFLLLQASLSADVILLGLLAPAQEVARYAVAQKIAATYLLLHGAFTSSAAPFIRRIAGDTALLAGFRSLVTRWALACAAPLLVVTTGVPGLLLRLFGSAYAQSSAMPLTLLSIAYAAYFLTGPAGAILLCTGREAILLRVTAAATTVLILAVAAVAPFGATAAAGAVLAASIFARALLLTMLRRLLGLPGVDAPMLAVIAGTVAGAVAARLLAPLIGEIGAAAIGCAIALGVIAFVVIREGDVEFLRGELRRHSDGPTAA